MATETTPTRRPFRGSCHCGFTSYIIFLTLPHSPALESAAVPGPEPFQAFARCNCTICHKIGTLHMRVPFAPDDFLLLSPLDPLTELGTYKRRPDGFNFLFCKNCGTRCFTFMGEGENADVDLGELEVEGFVKGERTKVWRAKREGWKEGRANGCYLSVNGHSVEAGQEGFDLGLFDDKGWVLYYDYRELHGEARPQRYGKPHEYGAY